MDGAQVRANPVKNSDRRTTKPKAERIALRVSSEEHALLEEASRAEARTLSAFVQMLDRPVAAKPRLAASLRTPTVFDDPDQ